MQSMLYLDLTYKCNQDCLFCVSNKTNNSSIVDNNFEDIFNVIKKNKEFDILHISGGEPTIHKHFIELCSMGKKYFDKVMVSTNGINFANENFTKLIMDLSIDQIIIPMFTLDPEKHDFIVNLHGSFTKIISALENLGKYRVDTKVIIKILAIENCIAELIRIPLFFEKEGLPVDKFVISGLKLSSKLTNHLQLIPSVVSLKKYIPPLISHLSGKGIKYSICDIPICIFDDTTLTNLMKYSDLSNFKEINIAKFYTSGMKDYKNEIHFFEQCDFCDIKDYCDTYNTRDTEFTKNIYLGSVFPIFLQFAGGEILE